MPLQRFVRTDPWRSPELSRTLPRASLRRDGEVTCRGIVTADVLKLGLSRGAIATRKLEGVMRDKEHEDLYWFGPLR